VRVDRVVGGWAPLSPRLLRLPLCSCRPIFCLVEGPFSLIAGCNIKIPFKTKQKTTPKYQQYSPVPPVPHVHCPSWFSTTRPPSTPCSFLWAITPPPAITYSCYCRFSFAFFLHLFNVTLVMLMLKYSINVLDRIFE